ncbi:hypothetical protein QFZ76_000892 [Streptomyces sp. V4I2]|nr:hypothetical protein [Streptomyces sp. V4I2]
MPTLPGSLPTPGRPQSVKLRHHRPSLPDGCRAGLRRAEEDHTLAFLTASSMAALNMGAYYVLASLADWKAFFRWTVPFRLLTCAVFTFAVLGGRAPSGFFGVGLW